MTTAAPASLPDLAVGDQAPPFETPKLTRTHFVRYAGASGDFNPIHHDEEYAKSAGNPSVFGHGMLTAGILAQAIARWVGANNVRRYRVRFVNRVWPGDVLTCGAKVTRVFEEDGRKRYELECTVTNQDGKAVLTGQAVAGLPKPAGGA
jgi:acyl dehydratase